MKLSAFSFLLALLCHAGAFAQLTPKEQKQFAKAFGQINQEVLKRSKAHQTLGEASATIGHRLTGTENGAKAEQYAFDLFKSYGFKEVAFQPVEVEAWTRGTLEVRIGPSPQQLEKVKAVTLAHSPVQADMTGQIVDVGNGLETDFRQQAEAVKGNIAMVYVGLLPGTDPEAKNLHRSEKTALAIRAGATGLILVNQVPGEVLLTGTASVTGSLNPIPAVCITYEEGMDLKKHLAEGQARYAHIRMTNTSGLIKARNVVATLPGTDKKDEYVVIGGHLDSWDLGTGAIDNGIGSFTVLDIARTFAALKVRPRRTIIFTMFMGEEQGLLGSKEMVRQWKEQGVLDKVAYMVNFDMMGNPKGFNPMGREEATGFFAQIGRLMNQTDTTFSANDQNYIGLHSDHQPFLLEGVPVLSMNGRLSRHVFRCYHANCDTFNLVEEDHIRNGVRFGAMGLYALAMAGKLPAARQSDPEVKAFLIQHKLKEALEIAGDWKWGE